MFRLLINKMTGVFLAGAAVLSVSCGFADLRPVEVTIFPNESGVVLPVEFCPVSVSFNTEMEKKEAENLLQVSHDNGIVDGDFFWKRNTLFFVPLAGWKAGTRYRLNLSGIARAMDGREIRVERFISFYAVNKNFPPAVDRHNPADGESVTAKGFTLEIYFSCEMDKESVETSISIDGVGDKKFEWVDDNTLQVIPERNLSPWTVYRWTLRNSAQSIDGVPLVKTISAVFSTDLDREIPKVSGVFPVLQSNGQWIPTGGSLENDFGPGLGIKVEFSKPMGETAFRSLRFEPSLSGRTEKLSEKSMVFIPGRDPEPETAYTLIISGDAKDIEGLKIGSDYRRVFTVDIPFLRILSIKMSGADQPEWNGEGNVLFIEPGEIDGLIRFTIHFSLPFTKEAKQKAALAISLRPYFPSSLPPVALRFVAWYSDDRLTMEWERLSGGIPQEPNYYKLLVPGGRGGIDNGSGMYLQNELFLYMEAVK